MSDKCIRCGSVGQDRRTLWMACFYEMGELGIPFGREVLFDADVSTLEKSADPFMIPGTEICLQSGKFRCSGELTPMQLYTARCCKRCRAEWLAAIVAWFQSTPQGEDSDADDEPPYTGCGSGIFVRRNGVNVEITREEWDTMNPGREPVRVEPAE